METSEDYLNNVKSYGVTPPYHKVEIVRNEIIYVPDKESYPVYWEQKDKETLEKLKTRCSCKEGVSFVMDTLKQMKILFNIEEFSIIEGSPSEECISIIETEFFEIDRSEILVLTPYHNITPFVANQLTKAYPSKNQNHFYSNGLYFLKEGKSKEGKSILLLKIYKDSGFRIVLPWQDYVAFLKERGFDIPQYTIPGCL